MNQNHNNKDEPREEQQEEHSYDQNNHDALKNNSNTQQPPQQDAKYEPQKSLNDNKSPQPPVLSSYVPQQTYNKSEMHTHVYKIVLVGDAGVGKTHIINRYVKGSLPHAIIPTIGIEFATKTVQLRDGGTIKTQIWDTAGQEKYRSITSAHYRKAVGALLVYDVMKIKSFEAIQRWLEEIRLHADKDIVLMLVGNKVDLATANPQWRQVGTQEAKAFAKQNGLLFEESSAKMDVNINDVFERLLEEIYDAKNRLNTEMSQSIVNSYQQQQKGEKNTRIDLKAPVNNSDGTQSNNNNSSLCACN